MPEQFLRSQVAAQACCLVSPTAIARLPGRLPRSLDLTGGPHQQSCEEPVLHCIVGSLNLLLAALLFLLAEGFTFLFCFFNSCVRLEGNGDHAAVQDCIVFH